MMNEMASLLLSMCMISFLQGLVIGQINAPEKGLDETFFDYCANDINYNICSNPLYRYCGYSATFETCDAIFNAGEQFIDHYRLCACCLIAYCPPHGMFFDSL